MDDDFSHTPTRNATMSICTCFKSPKAIPSRVSQLLTFQTWSKFIPKFSHSIYKFTNKFKSNANQIHNKIPHLYNQSNFLYSLNVRKHVSTCRIQHNRAFRTHVLIRHCTTIILCNVRSYTEGLYSQPDDILPYVTERTRVCKFIYRLLTVV